MLLENASRKSPRKHSKPVNALETARKSQTTLGIGFQILGNAKTIKTPKILESHRQPLKSTAMIGL